MMRPSTPNNLAARIFEGSFYLLSLARKREQPTAQNIRETR